MEELMEMVTWQQLGYHRKPVGLLNINGFYDSLLVFFDHCVFEGFIRSESREILIVGSEPAELLSQMEQYVAPVDVLTRIRQDSKQQQSESADT
jgi:cytokinin riboside 5'-monophosphate phosphoribohydrolase